MADGCFLILCGIPASGKSTLANELTLMNWEIIGRCVHFINVSYDDFISERRHAGSARETSFSATWNWKEKRRDIVNGLEELVLSTAEVENDTVGRIHEKSCSKRNKLISKSCVCGAGHMTRANNIFHVIVIDDNMYYRSMRYEYYQLARKASFGFAEIYVHCPLDVSLSRNENRREAVARETIVKMVNRLEKPDPQKFPWERFSITFDGGAFQTNDKWRKILDLLESAASDVPPPLKVLDEEEKVKDRMITERNIVYRADQVMRKHISSKLEHIRANIPTEDLKHAAQSLNQRKKKVLENIKADPRQMTTAVLLEQHKFSREFEESRTVDEGNIPTKLTSKYVHNCNRPENEDAMDTKNSASANMPLLTTCDSNEGRATRTNRRQNDVDVNGLLLCSTAELDNHLFVDDFWDVVSVDEFATFVEKLFEQYT